MPNYGRKRNPHENQPEPLVLMRAAPSEPARFSGSRTFGDYVLLNWETEYGTIGWAHPTHTAHTGGVAVPCHVRASLGPHAQGVHGPCYSDATGEPRPVPRTASGRPVPRRSDVRGVRADLAPACRLPGTPVPWFHYALRDKKTITGWKPGDPPAIVPAQDAELRTGPLWELAADEPDGSPAAAVCLGLARHLRRLHAAAAQRDISEIRAAAKDPNSDCAYVRIARGPRPGAQAGL